MLCCGGKQRCYPNRDLCHMDFGQQESQQEGLSHEIPELVATVPSHFPYTLSSGNRSYLALLWG